MQQPSQIFTLSIALGVVALMAFLFFRGLWKQKKTKAQNAAAQQNQSVDQTSPEEKKKEWKNGELVIWSIAAAAYALIALLAFFIHRVIDEDSMQIGDTEYSISLTFLVVAWALLTVTGLVLVKKDERAGFYFLERFVRIKGPGGIGFSFGIFWILTVSRVTTNFVQVDFEFEFDSPSPSDADYENEDPSTYKDNNLHKQLHVKIKGTIEWDVLDLVQFFIRAKTVAYANTLFLDNAKQHGRAYCGKKTPAMINRHLEEVALHIKEKLARLVEKGEEHETNSGLGINIRAIKITDVIVDTVVSKELDQIAIASMGATKAVSEAAKIVTLGDAEEKRLAAEGRGKAVGVGAEKKAINDADVEYKKELMEIAKDPHGMKMMQLEAVGKVLDGKGVVLNGEQLGLANLMSVLNITKEQGGTQ